MALGLFLSSFAATEFQAIQFLPAFVLPQLLLAGLFVPREQMPELLQRVSDAMPFTYAYDGLAKVATASSRRPCTPAACATTATRRWSARC